MCVMSESPWISMKSRGSVTNPLALERLIQARLSFAKGYRWGAWYEVENLASPMIDALNIRYILAGKPISTVVNGTTRYSSTIKKLL